MGAVHLWNLFPWFGLSPDLRVRCRRRPFERAVAVLPRPIKGEEGALLFFFFFQGGWLEDFLSNDDLKAHGVWLYD